MSKKKKKTEAQVIADYKTKLQKSCKHIRGYITNTGEGNTSVCIDCGKPWRK